VNETKFLLKALNNPRPIPMPAEIAPAASLIEPAKLDAGPDEENTFLTLLTALVAIEPISNPIL
jgi:hypothetical protein